jgi:hypothetical protein
MNIVQKDANADAHNGEIEEVVAPEDGATDDEKAEYYAKVESNNKQLYARLKKSEGFVKDKDGKWVKETKPPTVEAKIEPTIVADTSKLSQSDLLTLARTDIADEDIADVVEYATLKKISISEALKSSVVKGILADKAETRKVAEGTSTGGGKRGNAKLSDEALMANARAGKMPESDEDISRLSRLALGIK